MTDEIVTRSQPSSRPSPRELANQKIQLRKQQEKLLSDLLPVIDALDRAAEHWHQAEQNQRQTVSDFNPAQSLTIWQRWQVIWNKIWQQRSKEASTTTSTTTDALPQVITSARSGINLIRDSMRSVLSQHEVIALPAVGEPFDPTQMHALGQKIDDKIAPNTVIQEVVRGYRWKDRILREAQVIVAVASKQEPNIH